MNNDNIEYEEEYDTVSTNISDIFKLEHGRFLYWDKKDEKNTDNNIWELDNSSIKHIGYYYNRSSLIFSIDNFEGEFEKSLVTFFINDAEDQDEYWPIDGEFLIAAYYGEQKMEMNIEFGTGKGSDVILWDKDWNNDIPILYIKEDIR